MEKSHPVPSNAHENPHKARHILVEFLNSNIEINSIRDSREFFFKLLTNERESDYQETIHLPF